MSAINRVTTTNPDRACPHLQFDTVVDVARVVRDEHPDTIPHAYVAEIRIECGDCGEKFRWSGLKAGMNYTHPMVSVDETELRAPLRPASADPDFGMGLPGFSIQRTA